MVLKGQIAAFPQGCLSYPEALFKWLGGDAPTDVWTAGPVALLNAPKVGFFCSSRCPGSMILKILDAITRMRDASITVIGGFHTVVERECLGILLRGRQPVIWAPARSIVGMRLRPDLKPAFDAGRLLILSPFADNQQRMTASLAVERNRFVGAVADRILVPYAAPGGRTAALCEELKRAGKKILSADDMLG